ncbi:MAG: FecR domain-containing protein [Pseudomonadota bacterium]
MTEPEPPIRNQLLEEAAAWFARMRGPDADASRDAFEAWLARGALHRGAYNRAAEIFAMGKLLGDESTDISIAAPRSVRGRSRFQLIAASGLILLLVAAGWWLLLQFPTDGRRSGTPMAENGADRAAGPMRVTTTEGERRTVRLTDGSLLILAGGTSVMADIGPTVRRLSLAYGSARFDVAHDPRPFVVEAGGGSVVARGTIFEVSLGDDRRVSVRLIDGAVDVTLPIDKARSTAPTVRRLEPGETVNFAIAMPDPGTGSVRSEGAQAPPKGAAQGAREFDGVRLAALLAEANRGSARPILLSNPADGDHLVSGRFGIDDGELLAERIAALFDFTIDRRDPAIILLTKG